MPEALSCLVNWSMDQPGIFRAWAFCDVENPASARVMEKAGMPREGMLRRWHICPTPATASSARRRNNPGRARRSDTHFPPSRLRGLAAMVTR